MRQHDAGEIAPLLDQIADIREHQVDARADAPRTRTTHRNRRSSIAAGARRQARRSTGSCRSRRRRRAARIRGLAGPPLRRSSHAGSIAEIYIARSNQPRSAVVETQHQPALLVQGFKNAALHPITRAHRDRLPDSPGLCEPGVPDDVESPAARSRGRYSPARRPSVRKRPLQRSRFVRPPAATGAGNGMPSGAEARLTPNPTTIARRRPAFRTPEATRRSCRRLRQHIIRPFQRELHIRGKRPAGLRHREACDEAEGGGDRGRHRGCEHQARRQIAVAGNPFAAAPATAGRLLQRDDPERSSLAGTRQPQRLAVGGVEPVVNDRGDDPLSPRVDRARRSSIAATVIASESEAIRSLPDSASAVNCFGRFAPRNDVIVRATGFSMTGLEQRLRRNRRRIDQRRRPDEEQAG